MILKISNDNFLALALGSILCFWSLIFCVHSATANTNESNPEGNSRDEAKGSMDSIKSEKEAEDAESKKVDQLKEDGDPEKTKKLDREAKRKIKNKERHAQVLGSKKIYPNRDLQTYVRSVGKRVASNVDSDEIQFTYTVIDSDYQFDAFTIPGGYIYISLRALHLMNSEAELAFVLGHEIAHTSQNHLNRRMMTGGVLTTLSKLVSIFGPDIYLGSLGSLTQDLGSRLVTRYGQGDELEADRYGAIFMTQAGYHPEAAKRGNQMLKNIELFRILKFHDTGKESFAGNAVRTHPPNWRRIPTLSKFIDSELPVILNASDEPERSLEVNREIFLSKLEGTSYGGRSRLGYPRKNTIFVPNEQVKFNIPDGWEFFEDYPKNTLYASNRAGDSGITFKILPRDDGELDLDKYARETLKLNAREGRTLTVARTPAYLAVADPSSQQGSRISRFALIDDEVNNRLFFISGTGKNDLRKIRDDKVYISTIFSFDYMSAKDFRSSKRLKIKIVEADEKTTMEMLAANSPIGAYAADELRLLNGLYPRGQPSPGQLLKIVE